MLGYSGNWAYLPSAVHCVCNLACSLLGMRLTLGLFSKILVFQGKLGKCEILKYMLQKKDPSSFF